jgi:hypothetical protein
MPCWRLIGCHPVSGPQPVQKMRRDKKFADARSVMKRIGGQLVQERKLALSEGTSEDVEMRGEIGKDLLSLLVKANMTDTGGSSMSDEDVQDRKPSPNFEARPPLADAPRPSHRHIFSSPCRNRNLYCRWPRDQQRGYRLVPSLSVSQPRGAGTPTDRDFRSRDG